MSKFNFSTDGGSDDGQTTFDFSSSLEPEVVKNPREVTYTLSDDEMEYVEELARKRAGSYKDGRTRDDVAGNNTTTGIHMVGLKAEYVVSQVYGDGSVDESISAEGDDGIDVTFNANGESFEADVKCAQYSDAWMQQKVKGDYWDYAEAFVVCYSEEGSNQVTIKGWATQDELIQESNIEPSPAGGNWENYTLRSYRNPPEVETGDSISAK